jgi:hypothetical protein
VPRVFESDADIVTQSLRARPDGSVRFDALSYEGLTYRVTSQVPVPNLTALALDGAGLSPIFSEAAREGVFDPQPALGGDRRLPDDIDDFLELPSDLDERLPLLAAEITADASTPFEQALFLERYFRNTGPDGFTYSVDIDTGHAASDLADWLLDPESPNYRTGYCEQFATSMAVLARSLNIPSRVVIGFTPGDLQDDGLIIVRKKNAHSWVELWMVGQGWVRFDPTPRGDGVNPTTTETLVGFDPALYIPEPETPDEIFDPVEPPGFGGELDRTDFFENEQPQPGIFPIPLLGGDGAVQVTLRTFIIPGLLVVLISIPTFKWFRRRRRLRRLREGDITAAWEDIVDRLTDLRHEVPGWRTPAEVADTTEPTLTALAAVYGEVVYGPGRPLDNHRIEIGKASYSSALASLRQRHSTRQHIQSWFRLSSLRRRRRR